MTSRPGRLGVVVGKFLPPHVGHSYLIGTACAGANHVLVIVCSRPGDLIPAEVRADMLRELHPDTTVVVTPDDIPESDVEATSRAWAARTLSLSVAAFGHGPDVAFTSEEYGPRYARYLGARHVAVDPARSRFPISGTAARADPWAAAEFMAPCVLAWFVRRVCVVGAESTGTTSLCRDLARRYGCGWVPEYGRQYCAARAGVIEWSGADFEHIARRQLADEDAAAREAVRTGSRLLVCDTDALATAVWHERYLGTRSAVVERLAAGRSYAVYILTCDDIPFVQDGIRDGEHVRGWMTARFRQVLAAQDTPWIEVRGDRAVRLTAAGERVDAILTSPIGAP
jgi:HTH-type transcriptional regulator, transcriptional repressor of NAD biosynthesis genes